MVPSLLSSLKRAIRICTTVVGVFALLTGAVIFTVLAGSAIFVWGKPTADPAPAGRTLPTARPRLGSYSGLAGKSIATLESEFYNGNGEWRMCVPAICNTKNRDWGADNLTYTIWLRWGLTHDPRLLPVLRRLGQTAMTWVPGAYGSSDEMMWDSVAQAREYQATGDPAFLAKSETAFARINSPAENGVFATGACPAIDYQWANGKRDAGTKTLETDSNYVKAALLLFRLTGNRGYLTDAEAKYGAIRSYFLTRGTALYTVFVIDNGSTCRQVPGLYLGSVNGNMIWAGSTLAHDTGNRIYLDQAIATARSMQAHLHDGAGIYTGLLSDIDVNEPLIEAMYNLATADHQAFARHWLLSTAAAASGDMNASGEFGRFLDGPPPTGEVTSWQLNGGVAVMAAAASLVPDAVPPDPGYWSHATLVPDRRQLAAGQPVRITFTGRAIAIMGTLGDVCCIMGHAQVTVDGAAPFSRVGIWQNRTSASRKLPDQVLFAWRWPTSGRHTIEVRPAGYNPVEGGSFFRMVGYFVVH